MTKKDVNAVLYRVWEMLAGSVIMSVIGCLLCISGMLPVGSTQRDIILALLPVIYIAWNVFVLRDCYKIVGTKKIYYTINLCATALFIITSAVTFAFFPRKMYSWLFLATYLGGFSTLGISGKLAILLFDTVITISIFLSPIGLEWIEIAKKEEEEILAMAPGILDVNQLEQHRENTEVSKNENKA